jgi:hypothetical protein
MGMIGLLGGGAPWFTIERGTSGLVLYDPFTRGDSATLGNGWTDYESGGTSAISSNACAMSAGLFQVGGGSRSSPTLPDDWLVQHTVDATGGSGDYTGTLWTRWDGVSQHTTGDGYFFQWNANSGNIFLKECNAGTISQHATVAWTDPASGFSTFRFVGEVDGSNLKLRGYAAEASSLTDLSGDLTLKMSATDTSTIKTDTNYGFSCSNAQGTSDNYIACGRNITVTGLLSGYKIQVDSRTAVAEVGGTVTIDVDTWALPATTIRVLNSAGKAASDDLTPSGGIYGGDIYAVS